MKTNTIRFSGHTPTAMSFYMAVVGLTLRERTEFRPLDGDRVSFDVKLSVENVAVLLPVYAAGWVDHITAEVRS